MVRLRKERLLVHPDFKKIVKADASIRGITVIEYTRRLSHVKSLEEEFNDSKAKKKVIENKGFRFSGF